MSEKTGILDETGQTISTPAQDVIEPLIQHIQERPITSAVIILAIGFALGKILQCRIPRRCEGCLNIMGKSP